MLFSNVAGVGDWWRLVGYLPAASIPPCVPSWKNPRAEKRPPSSLPSAVNGGQELARKDKSWLVKSWANHDAPTPSNRHVTWFWPIPNERMSPGGRWERFYCILKRTSNRWSFILPLEAVVGPCGIHLGLWRDSASEFDLLRAGKGDAEPGSLVLSPSHCVNQPRTALVGIPAT